MVTSLFPAVVVLVAGRNTMQNDKESSHGKPDTHGRIQRLRGSILCSTASLEGQDCMLYEYEEYDEAKQRFIDQIPMLKTNKHY